MSTMFLVIDYANHMLIILLSAFIFHI